MNEPVYREIVWEFFATFEFDSVLCRYDPEHVSVSFRLGGEPRMMYLLELGWRVGLYSEEQSSIRDDEFVIGGTAVKKVRDLKVRLAHRCIATTISGRKESTHRITTIDLFFLYCIYAEGVTCNIPYWLARYLKRVKDKDLTCGSMFVTWVARSFGLLTNAMVDDLRVEPRAHVGEEDEVEESANEEAGGSADMYQNMTREECSNWMYDHTVRHFQYLSTRDNLDPHLQIDLFPGREADYPPYGYTGHTGYDYRFGSAPPGGSK
ncbi:hypothetical protein Tco_0925826 [Tanacetum coccineum]|uniref:Uncharacterized protein n=1 Tax=Tanacetum coccineum TaxID=301880 RepID=A0ABQ5D991_9ASTR